MNGTDAGRLLDNLEYVDQETAEAYLAAVDKTVTEDMARQFDVFREEHDAHVAAYADIATRLGWPRGGPSQSDRFRAESRRERVERARDQDDTVEALLAIEQENLDEYRHAVAQDLPDEARAILTRHADDEQRHVDYLLRHTPEYSAMTPASNRFES